MKRMKLGLWPICGSLLLGVFILAAWPGATWAETDQADDGAVKIQTDVANDGAVAKQTDDKAAKTTKGKKNSPPAKAGDAEDDLLEEMAQDDDKVKAESKKDKNKDELTGAKEDNSLEINPELTGDFAQMARVGKLDGKQQLTLLQAQQDMESALQKWDDKWEEKIGRAEDLLAETNNRRKKADLKKWLRIKEHHRKKLADNLFSRALKTLTPKQLAAWNSDKLWEMVETEFTDLYLNDAQIEKIHADCDKLAKKIRVAKDISGNKKLRQSILKRAYTRLTKRQKREYRKIKAKEKRLEKEARRKHKRSYR
jgi:hypothetical protein